MLVEMFTPLECLVCAKGEGVRVEIIRVDAELHLIDGVTTVHGQEAVPQVVDTRSEVRNNTVRTVLSCRPGIALVGAYGVIGGVTIGREHMRVEHKDGVAAHGSSQRVDEGGVIRRYITVDVIFIGCGIPYVGDCLSPVLKGIDKRLA